MTPRVSGKVIGFRSWRLDGYKLRSSVGMGEWTMGVNVAVCRRLSYEPDGEWPPSLAETDQDHEAPDHDCTCGLYAWYGTNLLTYPTAGTPDLSVIGAVAAWGHIEAQPAGFRAQYAQPVVLAYKEDQPYRHVRDLIAIAGEMGVPCVPLEQLAVEALKHGQLLPAGLRPAHASFPVWWRGGTFPGVQATASSQGIQLGWGTPSPASPRPRRLALNLVLLAVIGINGASLGANTRLFFRTGHAINGVCALVSLLVLAVTTFITYRRRRRWRR